MEAAKLERDDALRFLLKTFREMTEDVLTVAKAEGDPAEWDKPTADAIVKNLMLGVEQLYTMLLAMRANSPTKEHPDEFELSQTTLAFMKFLGVPKIDIARKAGMSRPTLDARLKRFQKVLAAKHSDPNNAEIKMT